MNQRPTVSQRPTRRHIVLTRWQAVALGLTSLIIIMIGFGVGMAFGITLGEGRSTAEHARDLPKQQEKQEPATPGYKTVAREWYTLEVPDDLETIPEPDPSLDVDMSDFLGDFSVQVIVESAKDYDPGTTVKGYADLFDEESYGEGWQRLEHRQLKQSSLPNPHRYTVIDEYALLKNDLWLYAEYTRYIKTEHNFYAIIIMLPPSKDESMKQEIETIISSFVEELPGRQTT